MTIRYSAIISNSTWTEVGDRVLPNADPIRFFELTLRRVGDTAWPDDGAVNP